MDLNLVRAGAGQSVPLGESAELTVKEDGSLTRGNLMVAEMTIQPDFAPPIQHLHRAHEESWYVLEGELEFTSGTHMTRVGPGDWVLVPIGVPHTFGNAGDVPARFLTVMRPNLYLNYFHELSDRMARGHPEASTLTDEAREQISAELMAKYHTEIIDPIAWERDHRPA